MLQRISFSFLCLAACGTPSNNSAGPESPDAAATGQPGPDAANGAEPDAAVMPDAAPAPCTTFAPPFSTQTLLAERAGFGAATKGGSPNNVYHVTTLANSGAGSLRAALESSEDYWIVFDVNGTIRLSNRIEIESRKTIDGRGRDIHIDGTLYVAPGARDIIISDVKISYQRGLDTCRDNQSDDLISLAGSPSNYIQRVWLNHLHLSKAGDELVGVVAGAKDVTISWTHFAQSEKGILFSSNNNGHADDQMSLTVHHSFFDQITRRQPQISHGVLDFYNNYVYRWYEFGVGSQDDASVLSENNVYDARPGEYCSPLTPCPDPSSCTGASDFQVSKAGLSYSWLDRNAPGDIRSVGDVRKNGAVLEQRNPTAVFERSMYYQATPEPATDAMVNRIKANVGPRKQYCE